MTRPVIPAPSTRVVEQHSGTVLSGEALKLANDRLDTMASAARAVDELWAENNRLRRELEASSKANAVLTEACSVLRRELRAALKDAQFQKSRADGYVDELDGVGEMQTRVQELEAEVRELRGKS